MTFEKNFEVAILRGRCSKPELEIVLGASSHTKGSSHSG